jgi:radical SAM protein with 4Fe4S-binding SPASM domain
MKHNQHEIKKLEEFKKRTGIDKITIKTVAIPSWFYTGKELDSLANEYLPTIYSRYTKTGKKWQIAKLGNNCNFLRNSVICWSGDVCLCCYDVNCEYTFGNVLKTPFNQIWKSEKYEKARKEIKARSLDLCKKCAASLEMVSYEL